MTKKLNYTFCMAYKIALSYENRTDYFNDNKSLYKYGHRKGWNKFILSHMKIKKRKPKWTKEEILTEALRYEVKKDFQIKSPSHYHSARVQGFLNEACFHMKRNILQNEVIYSRICNNCKQEKSIELFCYSKKTKSGVSSICKKCHSDRTAAYCLENPSWKRAQTAKRRAMRKSATPPWISKDHEVLFIEIYKKCNELTINTGVKHEVDHIIPISNSHVCGLHVPWNLQVVTMKENREKLNKFEIWWN